MGVKQESPDRDALVVGIAQIIDHPSVYMGGPSRNSLRIATEIVKHHRADLCASGQQVRALDPRIYRLNAEALAEIKATVDGESDQDVGHIIYGLLAEIAALTPAPQANERDEADIRWWNGEATHEEIRAVAERVAALIPAPSAATPTAQEAVPTCFACEDNPKHPNIPCAVCGAHPPQPSETVAEAARVLINAYSRDDNLGRTLVRLAGEAQKYSPAAEAFLLEVSALRALKGEGQ